MKQLTARQRQALDAIVQYRAEKGYPPTVRELRQMLGVSSLRGVTVHLKALERKGWIERESTSRSIRVLAPAQRDGRFRSIPLLGAIAAGDPLLAAENAKDQIPLPPGMASCADEMFALEVKGNSMLGDHILDGDLVIVERLSKADDGQIVAVLIGDKVTVHRLDMRSGPPRLVPSNPAYEPIEFGKDDATILGKVVGLIRFCGRG